MTVGLLALIAPIALALFGVLASRRHKKWKLGGREAELETEARLQWDLRTSSDRWVDTGAPIGRAPLPATSGAHLPSKLDLLRDAVAGQSSLSFPSRMRLYTRSRVIYKVWPKPLPKPADATSVREVLLQPRMRAILSGEGFDITLIPPDGEARTILGDEVTAWTWSIWAKERGKQRLLLTLEGLVKLDDVEHEIALRSDERTIFVRVSVPIWLRHHWEWATGIAVALLALIAAILAIPGVMERITPPDTKAHSAPGSGKGSQPAAEPAPQPSAPSRP